MERELLLAAAADVESICKAGRAAGLSDAEILREVLASNSFVTILVKVLPVALPLVIKIVQEMREGKTFIEALIDNIDQIMAVVLAVIEVLVPQDNGPDAPNGPQINK